MESRKPADQRYFPRYEAVSQEFRGQMHLQSDPARPLDGQVTDVSRDGIGAVLNQPVAVGEHIVLRFANRSLTFIVRYCQEDLIHRGKYRVGLQRIGVVKDNVAQIFSALGYLA